MHVPLSRSLQQYALCRRGVADMQGKIKNISTDMGGVLKARRSRKKHLQFTTPPWKNLEHRCDGAGKRRCISTSCRRGALRM